MKAWHFIELKASQIKGLVLADWGPFGLRVHLQGPRAYSSQSLPCKTVLMGEMVVLFQWIQDFNLLLTFAKAVCPEFLTPPPPLSPFMFHTRSQENVPCEDWRKTYTTSPALLNLHANVCLKKKQNQDTQRFFMGSDHCNNQIVFHCQIHTLKACVCISPPLPPPPTLSTTSYSCLQRRW